MNDGIAYVTIWTPEGFTVVREDDPRVKDQQYLNERIRLIEERIRLIEERSKIR